MIDKIARGILPRPTPLKSADQITLERQALWAWQEYQLVKAGTTDYVRLGYGDGQGGVCESKLLEYLLIDGLLGQAIKREQARGKRP